MNVGEVMTTPPITVLPNTPFAEIVRLLRKHIISGVPVVTDVGEVVGVVSEGDLMQRAKSRSTTPVWWRLISDADTQALAYLREHGATAGELMTKPPICATESMPLGDAVALMHRRRVNRLPVVRAGQIVGVLTRADVLRAFADEARPASDQARTPTDSELEAEIKQVLAAQPWLPLDLLNVDVQDGAVLLRGIVNGTAVSRAVERLVSEVPGVRAVCNELGVNSELSIGRR
ncbi:MAG: CBS domain-containing protein [Chloroflexi bacterium]|nr:CBS domain-containing protein [Chloroflexota bacterium]